MTATSDLNLTSADVLAAVERLRLRRQSESQLSDDVPFVFEKTLTGEVAFWEDWWQEIVKKRLRIKRMHVMYHRRRR